MKYLLDTCVVSELAKKRPSESVLRWIESVEEDDLFVSSVTIVGRTMREGNARSPLDMQIAATAFKFGMTLVTRNIRDMQGVGVQLLNPFE